MLELIYDRTPDDVAAGTDKGYYRHTDLNRVQAAVLYVRGRYADAGYDAVPYPSFRTWVENDVPRFSQMDAYLRAVRSLDGLIPVPDAPFLPMSPDRLDWRGANAIEKFLALMDDSMDRISGAWFYCDEVFSNEVDA